MTTTRYLIARVAQAFGYVRKAQRRGDAAREMHLLREAEAFLGLSIWESCKDIEKLSVEYWNLRKLKKEHDNLQEKINEAENKVAAAHEERDHILEITPETNQDLIDQRTGRNLARHRINKHRAGILPTRLIFSAPLDDL